MSTCVSGALTGYIRIRDSNSTSYSVASSTTSGHVTYISFTGLLFIVFQICIE